MSITDTRIVWLRGGPADGMKRIVLRDQRLFRIAERLPPPRLIGSHLHESDFDLTPIRNAIYRQHREPDYRHIFEFDGYE